MSQNAAPATSEKAAPTPRWAKMDQFLKAVAFLEASFDVDLTENLDQGLEDAIVDLIHVARNASDTDGENFTDGGSSYPTALDLCGPFADPLREAIAVEEKSRAKAAAAAQ